MYVSLKATVRRTKISEAHYFRSIDTLPCTLPPVLIFYQIFRNLYIIRSNSFVMDDFEEYIFIIVTNMKFFESSFYSDTVVTVNKANLNRIQITRNIKGFLKKNILLFGITLYTSLVLSHFYLNNY